MINLRNALMTDGKRWTNPYITDGLVAMWDGEWNAGPGLHDPNATTWVDLSPSRNNLAIDGTVLSFVDNYLLWTPRTSMKQVLSFAYDIWENATCEAVMNLPSASLSIGNTLSLGSDGCGLGCFSTSAILFKGTEAGYTQGFRFARVSGFATYSEVCKNYIGPALPYINAEKISSSTHYTTNRSPSYRDLNMFAGTYKNGEIKIGSFRYYSRALTADEIAANYAIDKARFNLPDAT